MLRFQSQEHQPVLIEVNPFAGRILKARKGKRWKGIRFANSQTIQTIISNWSDIQMQFVSSVLSTFAGGYNLSDFRTNA